MKAFVKIMIPQEGCFDCTVIEGTMEDIQMQANIMLDEMLNEVLYKGKSKEDILKEAPILITNTDYCEIIPIRDNVVGLDVEDLAEIAYNAISNNTLDLFKKNYCIAS